MLARTDRPRLGAAVTYQPPVRARRVSDERFGDAHRVVLADYVTTEDGTGLVHQSPAFGAEDLAVGRGYGLPVVNPIDPDGHFLRRRPAGRRALLQGRGPDAGRGPAGARACCCAHERYEHTYPHCWRCHTPLIYYALPSWYIRTIAIKDQLLAENERTNWYPPTASSTAATATG